MNLQELNRNIEQILRVSIDYKYKMDGLKTLAARKKAGYSKKDEFAFKYGFNEGCIHMLQFIKSVINEDCDDY